MALNAIHLFFYHRMMLGQVEFHLGRAMALEAGRRVLAGVDDKLPAPPASGDMKTAGAMASLAAGLPRPFRRLKVNAGVSAGWKDAGDVGVTFRAGFVADETRPRYLRRSLDGPRHCRAGVDQQGTDARGDQGQDESCCLAWFQAVGCQ